MYLIPCTDPCVYQREGRCTLTRAGSGGRPRPGQGCVHFLPCRASSQQDGQGLPDVPHRNEL